MHLPKIPFRPFTLNIGGQLQVFERPAIIGILNVTPDSFYDGGKYHSEKQILERTETMIQEGVDIIDIGGYSSRPYAKNITQEEEQNRVLPAVRTIKKAYPQIPISIDTFRSGVAQAALEEGAAIVNDISGGELDTNMFALVAKYRIPYILMHMKGTPQNMVHQQVYEDITADMLSYFSEKIDRLQKLGVHDIIIDLGFGFAKNQEQNEYLLHHLSLFQLLKKPILTGISRKSMIYKKLGISAEAAIHGTTAYHTIALLQGSSLLRVHDVLPARQIISLLFSK